MTTSGRRRVQGVLAFLCLTTGVTSAGAAETRYHQYSRRATGSGGKVQVTASTFFGGAGAEILIDAAFAGDGSIVAVGNAWGPEFPEVSGLVVLGEERPSSTGPYKDEGKKKLDEDHPGMAGFVLRFSGDLKRALGGARFGWGSATITHATFGADGTVLVSGRCAGLDDDPDVAARPTRRVVPERDARAGGGDLYLARLSPGGARLDWLLVFEKAEAPSAAWERRVGRRPGIHAEWISDDDVVLVAYDTLWRLDCESLELRRLAPTRGGVLWAADPKRGACYVGGDENTNTGREPWRRPFLRKLDGDGKLLWEIWRWDSKRVGLDAYRLVSDSSVRHVVPRPDGELVLAGWSDGGNTVFGRQPADLDEAVSYKEGFIDSLWGAGVGTFMRILRIDSETPRFRGGTIWCAFQVSRNKPNSLKIEDLTVLDDGRVVVVGQSSWALVETPDAWDRRFPEGAGGPHLAIFSEDLGDLLFSSLLPGEVEGPLSVATDGSRILIATGARPAESREAHLDGLLQLIHTGREQ